MHKALKQLYRGDFNTMTQEHQPDGSVIITLSSHNNPKVTRLHVKDLYGPAEELLSSEEINISAPNHVLMRMKEAHKDAG